MTDNPPLDRQNEGIEGNDPVRHGRFATGVQVDTKGHNKQKTYRLIKAALALPVLCINVHIVQTARFEKCENLRIQEYIKENKR